MSLTALIPVVGPLINRVLDMIPSQEDRREAEKIVADAQARMAEAAMDLAKAEAMGTAWQRNWRPLLSYTMIFLIVWSFVLVPVTNSVTGLDIERIDSENLSFMVAVWGSIYGFGRTMEKTGSSFRLFGK